MYLHSVPFISFCLGHEGLSEGWGVLNHAGLFVSHHSYFLLLHRDSFLGDRHFSIGSCKRDGRLIYVKHNHFYTDDAELISNVQKVCGKVNVIRIKKQ